MRRSRIGPVLCSLFFLGTHPGFAATLLVPSEYTTVQAAIDAATHGDEVVVSPGTYIETIHFGGKNIHVRSTNPGDLGVVEATVLHFSSSIPIRGSVVVFSGSETEDCSISGFTLTGGRAVNGGGILGNGALATVDRNLITENSASGGGGGISGVDGAILSNLIVNNTANVGGGISNCNGLIAWNYISDNTAERELAHHATLPGAGGGLHSCNGEILENTISSNFCYGTGGGLAGCNGLIQGNVIRSNRTPIVLNTDFAIGGGLFGCSGEIAENLITENVSVSGGGLSQCNGTIRNNLISYNVAIGHCVVTFSEIIGPIRYVDCPWPQGGGGLSQCNGTIQNNLIFKNETNGSCETQIIIDRRTTICPLSGGGGLYDCNGTVRNNTVYGNLSRTGGGGYHCEGTLENCIVWANSATEEAQISGATPVYSNIQNWTQGGWGNISENPLFVDAENGDFNLKAISPCIDAGRNVLDLLTDYDGDARPYNGTEEHRGDGSDYDIGAQEYRLFLHPGADIVKDLRIDPLDLLVMQRDWYRMTDVDSTRKEIPLAIEPDTDIDRSGRTDMLDLFILLNDWGRASESSKVFGNFTSRPISVWD